MNVLLSIQSSESQKGVDWISLILPHFCESFRWASNLLGSNNIWCLASHWSVIFTRFTFLNTSQMSYVVSPFCESDYTSLHTYIFISPNLKWTSYNSYVVSPFCECFVGLGSIFGEAIVSESTNPLSPRVWNFGQNNSWNKDKTYDANCFIIARNFCQSLCHLELLLCWNILKPIAPLQDMCVALCAIISSEGALYVIMPYDYPPTFWAHTGP